MSTNIILGPPGTGKTTRLLDIMEEEFKNGCQPDRMMFCSFTKKAVEEAISRATQRFNFTDKDMIYFKTIHSLAFHSLGLKKDMVMDKKDYKKIGEHLGLTFTGKGDVCDIVGGKSSGDRYSFIDSYSRAKTISIKSVWDSIDHDNLNWFELLRYCDTLTDYKKSQNKFDFADMLEHAQYEFKIDVVIIDEAQDLSVAQWNFINRVTKNAKKIYIGGDDDQAIFNWSGADVNYFMNVKGQVETLTQSYRVPKEIHKLASSITNKIRHRTNKIYHAKDVVGSVQYWKDVDHVDFNTGTWLLLARNSYLLDELAGSVRAKGHTYAIKGTSTIGKNHVRAIKQYERWRKEAKLTTEDVNLVTEFTGTEFWDKSKIWHEAFVKMPLADREYYISLLRRGESLTNNPRININTIHGVKGGEADNVVLLTDMAYTSWNYSNVDSDSEHRVWYVGATRAKDNLHIIMPRGRYHYNI